MDQMVSGYSCKRGTFRWPLAMFFNMLDIAGLAAFIMHKEMVASKQSDQRRKFLVELATQLVVPHMEKRASISHASRWYHVKYAMSKFGVQVIFLYLFL